MRDEGKNIGVFVCECGRNIAGVVDCEAVRDYAEQLPGVVFATVNKYTCSEPGQQEIKRGIVDHKLDRVVVASCTPRNYEPIFRDCVAQAGLNPYLMQMANIREGVSWVHSGDAEAATNKAKETVGIAVAKERGLTPFQEIWPIFTEKRERVRGQWQTTGIKGYTFKEHYSVQSRWAQQAGGYSEQFRETKRVTRPHPRYTNDDGSPKMVSGVEVKVGIITNRDYAALAQMAMARIPGWNYSTEREKFTHYATAFVEDTHYPPSGWTNEDVARKRAVEMALRQTFGKEPSQSRQVYAALTAEDRKVAAGALYGDSLPQRPALEAPQVVEGVIEEQPIPNLQATADAENEAAQGFGSVKYPLP